MNKINKRHTRTHRPHPKGQKTVIVTVVAVLAIAVLSLLVLFGKQFVGQAISIPSTVTVGQELPISLKPNAETVAGSLRVEVSNPALFDQAACNNLQTTINNEIDTRFTKNGESLLVYKSVSVNCASTPAVVQVEFAGLCDDADCSNRILTDKDVVALSLTTTIVGTSTIDVDFTPVGLATGDLFAENPPAMTVEIVAAAPDDSDGDGIIDPEDNCPTVANAGQENLDGDAYFQNEAGVTLGGGDACDMDADGDGYILMEAYGDDCNDRDATIIWLIYGYRDADRDGVAALGAVQEWFCLAALPTYPPDFTTYPPELITYLSTPGTDCDDSNNAVQAEITCILDDGDGACLASPECALTCPDDSDGDKIASACDVCSGIYNPNQEDYDADRAGDLCDSCPYDSLVKNGECKSCVDYGFSESPVHPMLYTPAGGFIDRDSAVSMDGRVVQQPFYAFFDRSDTFSIDKVFFYWDRAVQGTADQQENGAPRDVAGGSADAPNSFPPLNKPELPNGYHAIISRVLYDSTSVNLYCTDFCIGAENDADSDGYCERFDNCPAVANPTQADFNADGRGDACPVCGDALQEPLEECEDGNTISADGCSAISCMVEEGWDCSSGTCIEVCGDGKRVGIELDVDRCDDGDAVDGDGCSSACAVERGYSCENVPSLCTTTCGDGMIAGSETCDDGNDVSGDGCSGISCTVEEGWICSTPGQSCTEDCSDTLRVGDEVCYNGETLEGCTVEDLEGRRYSGTQTCDSTCRGWNACETSLSCGDGIINAGEVCDWGTATPTRDHNGDGSIDSRDLNGVVCDPEYGMTCDYCTNTCNLLSPGPDKYCGDGALQPVYEQCDDSNMRGGLCSDGSECSNNADCLSIGDGLCQFDGCSAACQIQDIDGDGVNAINSDGSQLDCDDTDEFKQINVEYRLFGDGVACGTTTTKCVAEGTTSISLESPPPDYCGEGDEDCDGLTDEDAGTGTDLPPLTSRLGVCTDVERVCPSGSWQDPVFTSENTPGYEGTTETSCDGKDNDCDGATDEDPGVKTTYYYDADGDGKAGSTTGLFCLGNQDAGYYSANEDCDDGDPAKFNGNPEICDGKDNDCDTVIDKDSSGNRVCMGVDYYCDDDGDGQISENSAVEKLNAPVCTQDLLDSEGLHDCVCFADLDCDDRPNGANDVQGDVDDGRRIYDGAFEANDGIDNDCDDIVDEGYDTDGDGYSAGEGDCDDSDRTQFPGNPEVCDGKNNDCSGGADDDSYGNSICSIPYYCDWDDDGRYGRNPETPCTSYLCESQSTACVDSVGRSSAGRLEQGSDCDDTTAARSPDNAEICYNRIDDNCNYDSVLETGLDCSDVACIGSIYCDGDGDEVSISEGDCDDTNPELITFMSGFIDNDKDTFGQGAEITNLCSNDVILVGQSEDCNDNNDLIYPGAAETCDGVDNDCDDLYLDDAGNIVTGSSAIDEGLTTRYYYDADGDGYGDASTFIQSCSAPAGYVSLSEPAYCLLNGEMNPGLAEECDGKDNDCDAATVESCPTTAFYCDVDKDGVFSSSPTNCNTFDCVPAVCSITQGTDCEDDPATKSDAAQIYPGAAEVCDGEDNNCNDQEDEGLIVRYYEDRDTDGYGNKEIISNSCTQLTGYVLDNTDCDDTIREKYILESLYENIDRDSLGSNIIIPECTDGKTLPDQRSRSAGDCNDHNFNLQTASTYYVDVDQDGYGVGLGELFCPNDETLYAIQGGDCDDTRGLINPGIEETQCDGVDNDCDYKPLLDSDSNGLNDDGSGGIDEGLSLGRYFKDEDNDGFGNPSAPKDACSQPDGYVTNAEDCNPSDGEINPDAFEECDGVDNDCDYNLLLDADDDRLNDDGSGGIDEGEVCSANTYFCDRDGDGEISREISGSGATLPNDCVRSDSMNLRKDCLDIPEDPTSGCPTLVSGCSAATSSCAICIFSTQTEICDGWDNNCNDPLSDGSSGVDEGVKTMYYIDRDGDGYGDVGEMVAACSAPTNYVPDNTDCNDDPLTGGSEHELIQAYVDGDHDGRGAGDRVMVCAASSASLPCNSVECYSSTDTDCNVADGGRWQNKQLYVDGDADGYGSGDAVPICIGNDPSTYSGYSENGGDCNDNDREIKPSAAEICDGVDNDCDYDSDLDMNNDDLNDDGSGGIDEGMQRQFYLDNDGDTYGDPGTTTEACSLTIANTGISGPDPTYVSDNTDCNDDNSGINTGAAEICDGLDNDCDGNVDEARDDGTAVCVSADYFCDRDRDTFYASLPSGQVQGDVCSPALLASNPLFVGCQCEQGTDCRDTNDLVNEHRAEICNGIDDNCDARVDEGSICAGKAYYCDADTDGEISAVKTGDVAVFECTQQALTDADISLDAAGDSTCQCVPGLDCHDDNLAIISTSTEVCDDSINNDCTDARIDCADPACAADSSCQDGDGDGSLVGVDCNDGNDQIYPGAAEACDGLDNNCDGSSDETFPDGDADGIGNDCDSCPLDADNDADGDGVCGNGDSCPAGDDRDDDDHDSVPNACDLCPATQKGLPVLTTLGNPQRGCIDPFLTYLMTRLDELTDNPPVQEKIRFLADVGKRIKER